MSPSHLGVFFLPNKGNRVHLFNCWVERGGHQTLVRQWICGMGDTCLLGPPMTTCHLSCSLFLPPSVLMLLLPDHLSQDPVLQCLTHGGTLCTLELFLYLCISKNCSSLRPEVVDSEMPAGAREMMWILRGARRQIGMEWNLVKWGVHIPSGGTSCQFSNHQSMAPWEEQSEKEAMSEAWSTATLSRLQSRLQHLRDPCIFIQFSSVFWMQKECCSW